jgi:hypothetical protein
MSYRTIFDVWCSDPNYAKALDDHFGFCASQPLSRELLLEWKSTMESLSPSTINVRLSAVRKLVVVIPY